MIASHYADPIPRELAAPATLHAGASKDAAVVADLRPGDAFLLLDDTAGWAWGYAGDSRLVGYVPSSALAP